MDLYVIKLDEVMWGSLLVAITMAIHGTGMFSILRLVDAIKERFEPLESFAGGLGLIILEAQSIHKSCFVIPMIQNWSDKVIPGLKSIADGVHGG